MEVANIAKANRSRIFPQVFLGYSGNLMADRDSFGIFAYCHRGPIWVSGSGSNRDADILLLRLNGSSVNVASLSSNFDRRAGLIGSEEPDTHPQACSLDFRPCARSHVIQLVEQHLGQQNTPAPIGQADIRKACSCIPRREVVCRDDVWTAVLDLDWHAA